MTKETRKALRQSIIDKLDDDMMPFVVAGHTITDQYVYAGMSQWSVAGREWEESVHAYAYIVDGQWQLTFPKLDYFDGQNQIERQTKYYLQPDRSETAPSESIGEPLLSVPDRVLLEIAKGIADAIAKHAEEQSRQDTEAAALIGHLTA